MKYISKNKYYQIVGLLVLAKGFYKRLNEIEKSMADLLGEKKKFGSYGHISDQMFEDSPDADIMLEKMDIEVRD